MQYIYNKQRHPEGFSPKDLVDGSLHFMRFFGHCVPSE